MFQLVALWLWNSFRKLYHYSPSVFLIVSSCTYNGALYHYTIEPINEILEHQTDVDKVRILLFKFRGLKQQELVFVEKAALLSAAAVIGVFSWPGTATSFWLCPTLWYSSLFLSIFALISSSQLRLVEQLPRTTEEVALLSNEEIRRLMLCIGREDRKRTSERRLEEGNELPCFKTDPILTWTWQSPMMLMSYSWLLFLVGYLCYVLTPLIPRDQVGTRPAVEVSIGLGALVIVNFQICGSVVRSRLRCLKAK
ncbi:hypothetical protein PGQ11_015563 [Apiospora arundinis]|uniref:Uncharacterized protein n=1 Tax=Apiospora arundinis TaxID=335852 RepID=A0ABR2HLR6_9PEZI